MRTEYDRQAHYFAEYTPNPGFTGFSSLTIASVPGDVVLSEILDPTDDPISDILDRYGWRLATDEGTLVAPNTLRIRVVRVPDKSISVDEWDRRSHS